MKNIETGFPVSVPPPLVEINRCCNNNHNQDTWIHPKLAIALAQWILPKFALQVYSCILELFDTGSVSLNKQLLDRQNEITQKNQRIQQLQDICMRKQQRIHYHEINVIDRLTTADNKAHRKYVLFEKLSTLQLD